MSDTYQAIYDAVRSRISGTNIAEAVADVARNSFDISHLLPCILQDVSAACAQYTRPFITLRPKMFIDGDQWCALYGENLNDGVAGFGDTPDKAAIQFDIEWLNAKAMP